ncbi:hypothetical protein RugamoR1_01740 [Rugamonas sp. R1(2021)]
MADKARQHHAVGAQLLVVLHHVINVEHAPVELRAAVDWETAVLIQDAIGVMAAVARDTSYHFPVYVGTGQRAEAADDAYALDVVAGRWSVRCE